MLLETDIRKENLDNFLKGEMQTELITAYKCIYRRKRLAVNPAKVMYQREDY